jgi:hypothetical protein
VTQGPDSVCTQCTTHTMRRYMARLEATLAIRYETHSQAPLIKENRVNQKD